MSDLLDKLVAHHVAAEVSPGFDLTHDDMDQIITALRDVERLRAELAAERAARIAVATPVREEGEE